MRSYKLIIFICLGACTFSTNKPKGEQCSLEVTGKLELPASERTIVNTDAMFPFDCNNKACLGFLNSNTNEILIYNLDDKRLDKKIKLEVEGDQGVGMIKGFMIFSPDSIFITSKMHRIIYIVNDQGQIIKKVPYKKTIAGDDIEMAFYSRSDINTPLIRVGSKTYLTNYLSGNFTTRSASDLMKHPICIELDLNSGESKYLPLSFVSNYWKDGNFYEPSYARIYNGKKFVYLWRYSDKLLVTDDHVSRTEYKLESKYFTSFGKMPVPTDVSSNLRDLLISPGFFNILWDKYRRFYYVFAYPGGDVESDQDLMNSWRYLSRFSIIILNENFDKIGETMMPDNRYYIENFFVGKEGLFLSKCNPNNPEFSDDVLSFDILSIKNF